MSAATYLGDAGHCDRGGFHRVVHDAAHTFVLRDEYALGRVLEGRAKPRHVRERLAVLVSVEPEPTPESGGADLKFGVGIT